MEFQWDESKDASNRAKHGLSFAEAAALFEPGNDHLEIFDDDHSEDEDRFIAIGPIARGLIVVVYTEPDDGVVRIVSARVATRREQTLFRDYMEGVR